MNILFSWIGLTDLAAASTDGKGDKGVGPIHQALSSHPFDQAILLYNYSDDTKLAEVDHYLKWLSGRCGTKLIKQHIPLKDPTNYREIWDASKGVIGDYIQATTPETKTYFHTSPGTPQMQVIWIMLAKTTFNAQLIKTTENQAGISTLDIPFEFEAEFIPDVLAHSQKKIRESIEETSHGSSRFGQLIYSDKIMGELIYDAKRAAAFDDYIPILILGETGTGKDLLAQQIHNESPRKNGPFIKINCGAIPKDIIEAELFGTTKGSYTGATDKVGFFEAADSGTIFLDEIGELPLDAQVKILRVIQNKEVTRVGENTARPINIRIIAATHKDLQSEVINNNFREDLFYRLAIAVLKVPPVRERGKDVSLLIDTLFEDISDNMSHVKGEKKRLSKKAKQLLLNHHWPGNVRELENTLKRMILWSDGVLISEEDCMAQLFSTTSKRSDKSLDVQIDVSNGINLQERIDAYVKAHIADALKHAKNNKSEAARLLGYKSSAAFEYQLNKHNFKD